MSKTEKVVKCKYLIVADNGLLLCNRYGDTIAHCWPDYCEFRKQQEEEAEKNG
jgi:hypothetical protein